MEKPPPESEIAKSATIKENPPRLICLGGFSFFAFPPYFPGAVEDKFFFVEESGTIPNLADLYKLPKNHFAKYQIVGKSPTSTSYFAK